MSFMYQRPNSISGMRSLPLLAALAASASAAAQQPPPPTDQSEIVVTGQKTTKEAIGKFVRDLTPVDASGRLGRFEHSVCPRVFGLAPSQQAAVEARIRLVAKAAGIVVSGAKCAPNIVVIVAADKRAVLEELRRHHGDYFGELSGNQIHKLVTDPAPGAAWQLNGPPMSADGKDIYIDPSMGLYVNHTFTASSRMAVQAYPQFDAAVVIVERRALDGLTTTQLADYAALRTLTGADPARLRDSNTPTILRALTAPMGSAVPITMTDWDLAFLLGYYDAQRKLSTPSQRSAIAKDMADKLHPAPR